jgi:glycolate oxidase FAD binding subunit
MNAVADTTSMTDTVRPADQAALAVVVADAHANSTPIYPTGGGTSQTYGLPVQRPGIGLSLSGLNRVIDYPARDMTITVEAGITMDQLAATLATEHQWLPIDAPQSASATLGGVMATAWSGARRYGYGTMRDYVIGMSAVDGRGDVFKAGGRVVKNVAGYDFCKLLTGSLGTLGVITQITLRIKPRPESSAFLVCDVHDLRQADRLTAAIINSGTTPSAVEVLTGPAWREGTPLGLLTAGTVGRLAVGLDGTAAEVDWMLAQLAAEWEALGVTAARSIDGPQASDLWKSLCEFPAQSESPLVLKASMVPSRAVQFAELVLSIDPQASIQIHAGNGIVLARFARFDAGEVSRALIGKLQPLAQQSGGSCVLLSSTLSGLTRQAVWGGTSAASVWMAQVKQQFDPKNILNPGRFVYDNL